MFLKNSESRELICRSVDQHTCKVLFDFPCRDGKDIKYFSQDLHNGICHSGGPRELDTDVQSHKYVFDAPKDSNEFISTTLKSSSSLIRHDDQRKGINEGCDAENGE
jgi:hypothetical protein